VRITETHAKDALWGYIERYSAQTVGYMADPKDGGDYRCFAALGPHDEFVGLAIVELGRLGFGPLADQLVGCLENILVLEPYRRQGIGTALLQRILRTAWESQARHVWWTVEYDNAAAIGLYQRIGAVFIAEEDPEAEKPERYYTVVVPNRSLSKQPKALGPRGRASFTR